MKLLRADVSLRQSIALLWPGDASVNVGDMLNVLYLSNQYRVDLILLVFLVGGACLAIRRKLRKKGPQYRIPRNSFLFAALLLLAGSLAAEWAARDRADQLLKIFAGFGPTYASELSRKGHARINLNTAPDDPLYLELIADEKRWLNVNPIIADVYTFRKDDQGRIRLIVDSETDYNHNGIYDGEREQRTPIGEIYAEATPKFYEVLEGKPVFESTLMPDRWGIWVSSFTPIYDQNGHVEAAVGIDYPADTWIYAIAGVRAVALGIALVLIAILLTSSTLISFLTAEIEERKETQQRLEQASESAFAASAAKSEYLALMSHEVRTPLSAILGFASILADTELNPKQRRYVETINRAGTSLLDLLNGILDYTRFESGKLDLEHIAWAPSLLVHEVMELMSARAAEKGLQLNFDDQLPDTLTLFGDPTRVRQIILNLVSNAVKFTTQGEVSVKAVWTLDPGRESHGQLRLEVSDSGPGIAAAKFPLLFQAFSQADTSTTRRHGGAGLGLAICKRLADMMSASLSLQSTPGTGSVFTFILASDSTEACSFTPKSGFGTHAPVRAATRALVVDDTRLNRELLKVMLHRLGFAVDLAAGGPEAIALAAASRYAIIFTDLEMPDVDGFATARVIRTGEPGGRHTPIVAVSALTASGTREHCIAAGMDDYVTKPVYLPVLKSVIETLLPGFKAREPVEIQPPVAAA